MRQAAVFSLFLLLTAATAATAASPWQATPGAGLAPRIVNGVATSGFPSVGLFLTANAQCSATLIGCSTVLTAAHCVCIDPATGQPLTGVACNQRSDLLDPASKLVYFHQAGIRSVASVTVNPSFVFGQGSDLAILHLAAPVTGIAPSPINTVAKPGTGTAGSIVGYGLSEVVGSGGGIKRTGTVAIAPCTLGGVNAAGHLCVDYLVPGSAPGIGSGTCHGDSGGPLFVDFGSGPVIAGTTSGGDSAGGNCPAPDHLFFSDVFKDRAWVQSAANGDLGTGSCGGLPGAGSANTTVTSGSGSLFPSHPSDTFAVTVPAGISHLRVGLTADNFDTNDYNLYVKRGAPATLTNFDCKSDGQGTLAFCDLIAPAAGSWSILVNGVAGPGGLYQLITTLYTQTGAATCAPSATTLCLDDTPADRRFKVEVNYQTVQGGGLAGKGNAVPLSSLGVQRGGLFWFFAADNPELLVKVLNACGTPTPRYWVFYSAGTNVGLTLTVTDTVTGRSKTYSNPDLTNAAPVSDTDALPCT